MRKSQTAAKFPEAPRRSTATRACPQCALKLDNDYIFALLGGTPPNTFLQKIGVSMVNEEVSVEAEAKAPA